MILVTGGTGFLGAHLLAELTGTHQRVRAIHRSGNLDYARRVFELYHPSDAASRWDRVEWVQADLLDIFSLEAALQDVSDIYHCAGHVSFVPASREQMLRINGTGTANLVNVCLELPIRKFCYVSSIAAIGRSRLEDEIAEDRFWKNDPNNSWYAISKYHGEREVWRGVEEGLPAVIVNPAVILGYCPWDEGSGKLFAGADKGMRYYTEGVTGWVDVHDVVNAMVQLMESSITGERYIVSAGNYSYRQVFEMMAEALGRKAPGTLATPFLSALAWRWERLRSALTGGEPLVTRETARTAQLKCYYSNKKLTEALSFTYRPLGDTIRATAALYQKEHP